MDRSELVGGIVVEKPAGRIDVGEKPEAVVGEALEEHRVERQPALRRLREVVRVLVPAPGVGRVEQRTGLVRTVGQSTMVKAEVPYDAGPDGNDRRLRRDGIVVEMY